MRLGRLDEETTVNVGTIAGGTAINVVPERCSLLAEVRGLGEERAEAVVGEVVERIHEAANLPDCDCDVDVSVQRTFAGYRLPAGAQALRAAEAALRACGYEPLRISSGGGSDANALLAAGLETVNLANGTERNHEPGERVSVAALEEMLDVALALLDGAAAPPPGGPCSLLPDAEAPPRDRRRGRLGAGARAGPRRRAGGRGSRAPGDRRRGAGRAREVGDEVIVNVQALDLGLGSGGFDVVHVNLTRGLEGEGEEGANVMKLNYTSLQHAVAPVEDGS